MQNRLPGWQGGDFRIFADVFVNCSLLIVTRCPYTDKTTVNQIPQMNPRKLLKSEKQHVAGSNQTLKSSTKHEVKAL